MKQNTVIGKTKKNKNNLCVDGLNFRCTSSTLPSETVL